MPAPAAAAVSPSRSAPDAIRDALVARLALSTQVAHAKFVARQPIEDPAREAVVVASLRDAGAHLGLAPDGAAELARALIGAAKAIQRARFAAWSRTASPPGPVPDLALTVRPAIDRASADLLLACALELNAMQHSARRLDDLRHAIAAFDLGREPADELLRAIVGLRYRALERAESTLDLIAARAVLRVGLPGDYPPFGLDLGNGNGNGNGDGDGDGDEKTGIDVDLARQLAASLGAKARFIPTTWATLLDDLAAQRFDIAMGGITRTLPRARVATFSDAYFEDGKGAIARCAVAAHFTSLSAIDQPGVRVIVNPGGTNEQFVRARITRATIMLHPDNTTVFTALAAGAADVMITDLVEARFQAALNPRLCVALRGERLTTTDKAVLLPRDSALTEYVNLWLYQLRSDGRLEAIVNRYLPTDHRSLPHAAPVRQ